MTTPSKPLIVAEKPSAARAIAEALGGFSRRDGYLESPQYLLAWAVGHLVELMAPEDYETRWKRWTLDSLPVDPSVFGLKVVARSRTQFELITRLARSASDLINACDAGREGELIFRFITEKSGLRLPTRRLWISSLTGEAIRKGFADLRPAVAYDRLYQSALCRARGDWLVGMNGTRAFTVKWGELLSVGRVQTPTLALLARREAEIEAFVPQAYWEVLADFAATQGRKSYQGKWFGPEGDRLKAAADAEAVRDRVLGRPGTVESVAEKPVTERPPQLYDLTSLQRDANRRFGLTAAATLKAAQALYERKLITYPRTDSRHITKDLVRTLPGVVKALGSAPDYAQAAAGANLSLVHPGNRRVVDDAKVTDHHAIIPTEERPLGITGPEDRVYSLVARRFLAQFYPDARYQETEVITLVGVDRFRSRGRQVLDPGWTVVEPEPPRSAKAKQQADEEDVPVLPALTSGEAVQTRKAEVKAKTTQPPKRFTEASLLSSMEFAGREMDDDALKEAMKGRGLGTPATRASIIERLKEVGYITAEKKTLVPTPKGRLLVQRAEQAGAQVLLSAELTGEWEKRIADIQAGSFAPEVFMTQIRDLSRQVITWVRGAENGAAPLRRQSANSSPREGRAAADDLPEYAGKCPRCGRAVVRGSKGWACAGGDCGLRIPVFLCGKVIDAPLAATLLQKGRSALITGFKSARTGKLFTAFLVLKAGAVEFEFPPDRPRKVSGYRRQATEETSLERATEPKARSRKTGNSTAAKPKRAAGATAPAGGGVARRATGSPKPPGTGT